MSNTKAKQKKPKTGLARCMELASDRKGLVFLAAVLSSLAAIASFIPYIAVYLMIRQVLGVYPELERLDMALVMRDGWLALVGIACNILLYFLAIFCSHLAAFGTLYDLKLLFAEHITKIPLGYHLTIGSGRLRKIMDDNIESVEGFIAHQFPDFVASVTALVGPSGSGKSTIAGLIARFWDVQQGAIRVGGQDIRSIEPESLMGHLSFVFQDVTLFNDTVMNNIRLGDPQASDDAVIAAAKAAYCDEFVRALPQGYETVLGENGSTLSGGERQRISIARALLKNAPIILLDEATASLDPENEVLVQKALAKLVEGKTVVMIAHRLRTVADADQILVLENGELVEQGTHAALMEKHGLYQRLYAIQQESLGWSV